MGNGKIEIINTHTIVIYNVQKMCLHMCICNAVFIAQDQAWGEVHVKVLK